MTWYRVRVRFCLSLLLLFACVLASCKHYRQLQISDTSLSSISKHASVSLSDTLFCLLSGSSMAEPVCLSVDSSRFVQMHFTNVMRAPVSRPVSSPSLVPIAVRHARLNIAQADTSEQVHNQQRTQLPAPSVIMPQSSFLGWFFLLALLVLVLILAIRR